MTRGICTICGRTTILPTGPLNAEYLLVGEAPDEDEFRTGVPIAGDKYRILEIELHKVGISLLNCRQMNLWPHAITDECKVTAHLDAMMEESKERKRILLMGASIVSQLVGLSVSDVSGLLIVDCPYFAKGAEIVPCMKVTAATHGGIGEVRLAIQRLARR